MTVAWVFAEFVNEESYKFRRRCSEVSLCGAGGRKEPLRAEYSSYTMGSDHDVYQDSVVRIPAIYLMIGRTGTSYEFRYGAEYRSDEIEEAAFMGGERLFFGQFFCVRCRGDRSGDTYGRLLRTAPLIEKRIDTIPSEFHVLPANTIRYEHGILDSIDVFAPGLGRELFTGWAKHLDDLLGPRPRIRNRGATGELFFVGSKEPRGPLAVFGYDYFADHAKAAGVAKSKLLIMRDCGERGRVRV